MASDGNTIRLRASCNACNESKVRCSQRKPTCARCERNGADCIYGLSRRTHKDAPPITMPPSQRARRSPSRSSLNGDKNSNSNSNSNSTSHSASSSTWSGFPKSATSTSTPSNGGASPDPSARTDDATLFSDYMTQAQAKPHFMLPPQQQNDGAATPQFNIYNSQALAHPTGQLLDFNNLSAGSTGPAPVAEYADPWALGSFFGGNDNNNNSDGNASTDMASFWARQMASTAPTTGMSSPSSSECTCHLGVTGLLASMHGGGDDRQLSLDAQLARLKRCIVSSETSMGCPHGREDAEPIHIMAVATLIGYVIDEFKMLASESSLRRSLTTSPTSEMVALRNTTERGSKSMFGMVDTTNTNMTLGDTLEPRLSWGVLELEDDDEIDLRQRLYLLSFRKLERLLLQLTLYLRNLHDARSSLPDLSRYMAFVMACDYTRLWLEKKAEDVKKLFSVSAGDEEVDPALV